MIEAHVGLPGSGKSLNAVRKLLHAKKQGRKTLANFHSQTGKWEFALWRDIAEAGNCLAVIDEAHMWFSARNWHGTQQAELSVFQQHRKEGLDLIWIAQHESRVDVAVRELTAFIWKHKKLGGFIIASKVTPDEPKQVLKRALFRINPSIHQHYFTEERIGFRDGEGYGFGGGTAYQRSGAPGPVLDENFRLLANYYRIEFPGRIEYHRVDAPFVASRIAFALGEYQGLGSHKNAVDLVTPLYRGADGRFHEINALGDMVPNEASQTLFEHAQELARSIRGSFSRGTLIQKRTEQPGGSKKDVAVAKNEPVRERASFLEGWLSKNQTNGSPGIAHPRRSNRGVESA